LYKYFQLVAYLVKPQKAQFPGIYHNLIMSILLLEMLPLLLSSISVNERCTVYILACVSWDFWKHHFTKTWYLLKCCCQELNHWLDWIHVLDLADCFVFLMLTTEILAFYKYFGLSRFKNPLILNMKWVHQYASDAVVVCPYFNL
jgi:hypothetical protein